MTAPHIAAHKRSAHHRVELKASARCGCFYCLETFVPTDVVDWIETIPFDETQTYVMRVTESLPNYRARLTGETGATQFTEELKRR